MNKNYKSKKTETPLDQDLGNPSGNINTNPEYTKKDGNYFWCNVIGESMTDNTEKSIPSGSKILCREFKHDSNFWNVPTLKPLVVIGENEKGKFFIIKTISFVDSFRRAITLRSYNPSPKYDDFYLRFESVKRVCEVELVILPDGKEFAPITWKDSHKIKGSGVGFPWDGGIPFVKHGWPE